MFAQTYLNQPRTSTLTSPGAQCEDTLAFNGLNKDKTFTEQICGVRNTKGLFDSIAQTGWFLVNITPARDGEQTTASEPPVSWRSNRTRCLQTDTETNDASFLCTRTHSAAVAPPPAAGRLLQRLLRHRPPPWAFGSELDTINMKMTKGTMYIHCKESHETGNLVQYSADEIFPRSRGAPRRDVLHLRVPLNRHLGV